MIKSTKDFLQVLKNIDKNNLVFLKINEIKALSKQNSKDLKLKLQKKLEIRKNKFKVYKQIKLPSFINKLDDIKFFTLF